MPYKKITGIYKITNTINNKIYVGSAISIKSRFTNHRRLLNRNKHFNNHLQSSWDKYGEESFSFDIVEIIDCPSKESLIERENFWISKFDSTNRNKGYNKRKDASTNLGIKASDETRRKLRLAHLGEKHPAWRNEIKAKAKSKKVVQYDMNMNIVQEWPSMKIAAAKLGIHRQGISMCCRKIIKQTGGYIWDYKTEI